MRTAMAYDVGTQVVELARAEAGADIDEQVGAEAGVETGAEIGEQDGHRLVQRLVRELAHRQLTGFCVTNEAILSLQDAANGFCAVNSVYIIKDRHNRPKE
ncbi:hypothetical protein M6D81_21765 [Paenibacillus sp. J5C_2022]|uniref:hypothetical protein n=1 Tax=Paenibacillus sp. J5C2022 TaxID=2977129 RepID=UPI0021CF80F2|nr:hypothetical protein [Paenibacillus sp. J5C2022]MCU6711325.1 hypothetical protein [Paenibacillus sp. J5C2022]